MKSNTCLMHESLYWRALKQLPPCLPLKTAHNTLHGHEGRKIKSQTQHPVRAYAGKTFGNNASKLLLPPPAKCVVNIKLFQQIHKGLILTNGEHMPRGASLRLLAASTPRRPTSEQASTLHGLHELFPSQVPPRIDQLASVMSYG